MRKFALLTVLLLAALTMPTARASTRLVAAPVCEEPVPTRAYDGKAMTYGISVDLSGCPWWDGSPIQMEASVSRLDGTGEEGSTTVVFCGERTPLGEERTENDQAEDTTDQADTAPDEVDSDESASEEDGGRRQADDAGNRSPTCEVSVGLEHPSAEVARYRGEVTYPWRDGPKTIGFSAICASPGSVCRDG